MTTSAPAISVIVVFHNAETTIERTLRSLAGQTFDDVEYIFVNDGSTDRSVELLEDFVALHPEFTGRHTLISEPLRRGVAHGSALGYAQAAGEYVMRCDADDYLEPDALEVMYKATEGGLADCVAAPYFHDTGHMVRTVGYGRHYPQSLNDMPVDTLNFSLWNKLLRRRMLDDNGIEVYDGVDCWEDLGVVARFMALRPVMRFVDRPLYHYMVVKGGASLSRSNPDRLLENHLMIALLLEQWFERQGLHNEYDEFLTRLKFCAKVKLLRGRDKDVRRWKDTFPEVNSRIMGIRHVAWWWKLMFALVAALPARFSQWIADRCDVFYAKEHADAVQARPHDSHPNIHDGTTEE